MVKALKDATTAIPIVGYTRDPVSFGIVREPSVAGGNVTGISTEAGVEIDGKRLSLIKEIMPTALSVGRAGAGAFWMSPYGSAIQMFAGQLGLLSSGRPLADPVDEAEFSLRFRESYNGIRQTWFSCPDVSEKHSNSACRPSSAERATCQRSPLRGSL